MSHAFKCDNCRQLYEVWELDRPWQSDLAWLVEIRILKNGTATDYCRECFSNMVKRVLPS